jgi:acetyltransferase-like isoleucine patch superfamily enzyme
MKHWFTLIRKTVKKIKGKIELSKYNNFTIAEYFRKQGAQIGENCFIAVRSFGTEPYLIKIGNHVVISVGVELHTHDGGTWIFRKDMPDLRMYGPIVVGDNCLIGINAQILPNVTIGSNSIVGAGSVVISDVPPNSIVMGIPARVFGSVDKYKEKCIEHWKVQKPPGFHPSSHTIHYELIGESRDRDVVMSQLRNHLKSVFKDKLK